MVQIEFEPFRVHIREACGLTFSPQILEIDIPRDSPPLFWLSDVRSGQRYPVQAAAQALGKGFLRLAIAPFEHLELELAATGAGELPALVAEPGLLANEHIQLQLAPDLEGPVDSLQVPGPIVSVGLAAAPLHGQTYFDTRGRVLQAHGQWLESGPLRRVWRYEVRFEDGGLYTAQITLDAGEEFAVVDETFNAEPGAQLVWDFAGAHLPHELFLLDSTAGGTFRQLHTHFDARHARLANWTQYQQLHDLSDGFALLWPDSLLGLVTLEGGSWTGNRLNHIEAWTRRFWRDDRRTRRAEPFDAKADSMPGQEPIPSRGEPVAQPHFCLEAWIGGAGEAAGHRRFALVAARRERLFPGAQNGRSGDDVHSGHFERQVDRPRYRREQSLLRQIHIQRGLLTLQTLAGTTFEWPRENKESGGFGYPHPLLEHHLHHHAPEPAKRIEQMMDYIAARVYGFWEGAGAAYTNCVVGRQIAPEMLHFEYLERTGALTAEQRTLGRAHFIFLCQLFHTDNYYPGAASMRPNGDPDSSEPTVAGMANQNFLTDVVCVGGMGAQVFPGHPNAGTWAARFRDIWHRQLEFHRYPHSGVWEESHTYFQHVLYTVLAVLLRRRDDGAQAPAEGFADPLFHSLCESLFLQLTPRHAHSDGYRHIIAWGDHEAGRHDHFLAVFGELALAIAPHNPGLAHRLAWLSMESGGGCVDGIEPEAVAWESGAVEGLGYCFRNTDDDGDQSLLALRAGGAWGHHHHDDGSVQFWARGQALIVDAAFGHVMHNSVRKIAASGHSRWSLRDFQPFDYYWRFNRGWISASSEAEPFPYAVAWTPVYMVAQGMHTPLPLWPAIQHWRAVIQLSADVFLILDESDSTIAQTVLFQLPGEVNFTDGQAIAKVGDVECRIRPLMGIKGGAITNHDAPRQRGTERFATSEVTFDLGTNHRGLFLVAGEPVTVTQAECEEETGWVIRAQTWQAVVSPRPDGLYLQDADGATLFLDETVLRAR